LARLGVPQVLTFILRFEEMVSLSTQDKRLVRSGGL
jgi:hypothetical protein